MKQFCYKFNIIYIIVQMSHIEINSPLIAHAGSSISLFIALENSLNSLSTDRSTKQIKADIFSFIQKIGPEGQKFAMFVLLQSIYQSQSKDKSNLSLKNGVLAEMIKQYSAYDNFYSYFPEVVTKIGKESKLAEIASNLINNLKLPLNIQIAMALSLYLSDRTELISFGENQLINKIKQFASCEKPIKLQEKLLEQLLFQINISPQLSSNLQQQSKILLEMGEKIYRLPQTRTYNYFKQEWQLFANQIPLVEKPMPVAIRKSDLLRDLGPSISQQVDNLKAVVSEIGSINQQDIFQCLMMMAQEKNRSDSGLDRFVIDLIYASSASNKKTPKGQQMKKLFSNDFNNKKSSINWNIDIFLQFCAQSIPNIKWQNVLANFDRENLHFISSEHFVEMMKISEKIKKLIKKWTFTDSIFFKKWTHSESQSQFLFHLFNCKDPEAFFFCDNQVKKKENTAKDNNSSLRQIWGYLDLLAIFFQVANKSKIKQVLQIAVSKYPDVLMRSLSQLRPSKDQQIINQIYERLLPEFLQKQPQNIKVIETIWNKNKQLLIKSVNNLYKLGVQKKCPELDLEKIVDIFQQIEGSLDQLISRSEISLSFPLCLIAGKKQNINFENWIVFKLDKNEHRFSKQMLNYLQDNLLKPLRASANQSDQKQAILEQANLSIQTLNKLFAITIQKLKNDHPGSKNNQLFKKMHKQCCRLFPQVAEGQLFEQAQKQCEQQIKKIYKQEISIKDAVENLKRLKNSTKKQERENFANRITFLCIEMTYYHSYPIKQLIITADLISALINENLIENKIFQIFLNVVQECLKEDNHQYIFAMKVVENIQSKLAQQTLFCQKLIDNQLVMKKSPQLIQQIIKNIQPPTIISVQKQRKIKQAIRLKNTAPENISRHMIIQPEIHHYVQQPHVKAQAVQYDILATLDKSKKIDIPDRQSKLRLINTICNTLSLANVDEKSKQLKKALDNQKTLKLLAYNIVFKRITITHNNGMEVFVKLLDNLPRAQKPIMKIAYRILQKWFSLQGKSANNDKKFSHFKNLGSWIGRMTISKGLPVPIHKLNLKQILVKSFLSNNRINFNVPVVLKILQFIHVHPQIFREQSPWLKRIMCTLNEIEINLKQEQNIKAEIKAFFKSSNMNLQILFLNEPSFLQNEKQISISQLILKTNISEEIEKLCENLEIKNIKMIVVRVLNASIQEIVQPVIDRTVKIAKITTMNLVSKDFATQINIEKFKQSCICLARELAQPLAQITCRQALKTEIIKNLKAQLKQYQSRIKQQQIQLITFKILAQILDIGCEIIKQKACRSAEVSIKQDSSYSENIQIRSKLKRSGSAFSDEDHLNSIPAIVPKQLRPSSNGLSEEEYFIYNEFKKKKNRQTQKTHSQLKSQQSLIPMLQKKEEIEKIKRVLGSEQLSEENLSKIYMFLLDETNDSSDISYFIKVLQQVKEVLASHVCWKVFKSSADIRNNQLHKKMLKKLIKQKYFDQSVLNELLQEQEKLIKIFQIWISIQDSEIQQFISVLPKHLSSLECSFYSFLSVCLKYLLKKHSEQTVQNTICLNPMYISNFVYIIVVYSYKAQEDYSLFIDSTLNIIIDSMLSLSENYCSFKYQRAFFTIFENLVQIISHQRQANDKPVDPKIKQIQMRPKFQQYEFSKDKIKVFNSILGQKLLRISPLVKTTFAFSWFQLVYNKHFIKNMLQYQENWEIYFSLLCNVIKFMNSTVTQQRLYDALTGQPYKQFYLAVFRLIILLIHDFSSFVTSFSLQLCILFDSRFLQLKNVINSAYPAKQMSIPLNFERREDLQHFVHKVGYPKYNKLQFDKNHLNYYVTTDPNEQTFKNKISQQQDYFILTLVLYFAWTKQNGLNQTEAMKKLADIIMSSRQQMKLKLVDYFVNLIRYPNYITLFFIDFVNFILFKYKKDTALIELILGNIITRMRIQEPIAWGLIHIYQEITRMKHLLQNLNLSPELLSWLKKS